MKECMPDDSHFKIQKQTVTCSPFSKDTTPIQVRQEHFLELNGAAISIFTTIREQIWTNDRFFIGPLTHYNTYLRDYELEGTPVTKPTPRTRPSRKSIRIPGRTYSGLWANSNLTFALLPGRSTIP
jgi:hypothetical protein